MWASVLAALALQHSRASHTTSSTDMLLVLPTATS
jgi:hypothetical protein